MCTLPFVFNVPIYHLCLNCMNVPCVFNVPCVVKVYEYALSVYSE